MNLQVLFICSGNTCRSPLAEVIARKLFTAPSVSFSSGGLQALTGCPASDGALAVAREMGLSLADHRSRKVGPQKLGEASWVIGMTREHVAGVLEIWPEQATGKVGLLGAPGEDLRRTGPMQGSEEVADPFAGELPEYRTAAGRIEELLRGWSDVFDGPPPGKDGPP